MRLEFSRLQVKSQYVAKSYLFEAFFYVSYFTLLSCFFVVFSLVFERRIFASVCKNCRDQFPWFRAILFLNLATKGVGDWKSGKLAQRRSD